MWIVSRRRHEAELAAVRSYNNALRERCETAERNEATERVARQTITRQHAELDAANTRLADRNTELTRRLGDGADAGHVAQLEARIEELTALGIRANAALDDMAAKVKAAEERANAARTTPRETPTVDGAPNVRREASSARLRRAEARCAALQQRLDEMQVSHIADTRELHDLRQGVTS